MHRYQLDATNWTKGQMNAKKLVAKIFADFTEIGKARSMIQKLFWVVVYLSGIVLTALTCKDIIHQYQLNPVTTQITTTHNKTMTPTNPTICLPFFRTEEWVNYYLNKTSLGEINFDDPEEMNQLFIRELKAFFGNSTWNETKAYWTPPMVYVAQSYLALIYETEAMRESGSTMNPLHQTFECPLENNISQAIVEVFLPKMKEYNVTLGEFKDLFAQKFKQLFPITVTLFDSGNTTNYNVSQELIFVSKHQVCYKVKLEDIKLTVDSSIELILDNTKLRYPDYLDCGLAFLEEKASGYEPITVDISGKARAGSILREFDSIYLAKMTANTILTVNPLSEHIAIPMNVLGIPQCSIEETMEECQGKCRSEFIQQICNCTSIASTVPWSLSSSGSLCLIGQFEECLVNFTGTEDTHCMSQCLDSCTQWQYDVKKYQTTYLNAEYRSCLAYIYITVSTQNYLLFTEFSVWTMDTIVGVLGGALGFWLGLDILIIIYTAMTTPILFLLERLIPFEENETQVLNEEPVIFWNIKDPVFAKWIVSKLVWTFLFIVGAVLTLLMFFNLSQQYFGKMTASTVTVILNKTMTLPKSALCTSIDIHYNNTDVGIFRQSEFEQYVSQANMSKEKFIEIGTNPTWPTTLTYMVFVYLRAVFLLEHGSDIIINNFTYQPPLSNEFNILNLTRNVLLKWSVTNEELETKFGFEFMKLKNISVSCGDSTGNKIFPMIPLFGTIEQCAKDLDTALSVCLHFPLEKFEYQNVNDRCNISVPGTDIFYMTDYYYLAIKSATSNAYNDDLLIVKTDAQMLQVRFSYSTIYQSIEQCSAFASPLDCFKKCYDETLGQICPNCTVTSNMIAQDNLNPPFQCTWKEYYDCLSSPLLIPTIKKICNDQCTVPSCTSALYTITNSVTNKEYFASDPDVTIGFQDFDYTAVTENYLYSQQDFIAATGGLLGFWLGLDCTFLVAFVVTPLMVLARYCFNKRVTSDGEQQHQGGFFSLIGIAQLLRVDIAEKHRTIIITELVERLFWMVIYLLFGAVTIKISIDFMKQYANAQISSTFGTMRNQTFIVPSTTVCIPSWLNENDNLTAAADLHFMKELSATKLRTLIFTSKASWPRSLLRISVQYLALVEGYKTMEEVNIRDMWSTLNSKTLNAIDLLDFKLVILNISENDLMQNFGEQLRQLYPVKITKYGEGSWVGRELSINRTTFISLTTVCYALPSETFSFASVNDYVAITVTIPDEECGIMRYTGNCMLYFFTVDLLGRDTWTFVDQFTLERVFTMGSSAALSIGEVIQMLPEFDGVQRCSEIITREECIENCRINAFEQQCHCIPNGAVNRLNMTTSAATTSNLCSWTQFKTCLPHFSVTNASNCIENCLPSCKRVRYVISTSNSNQFDAINQPIPFCTTCTFEHLFGASNFEYPFFTEHSDQATYFSFSFFAGLGGTVGVLLGIDVVMIIEFCFSSVSFLFAFVGWLKNSLKRKTRQENSHKRTIRIGNSLNIINVQPLSAQPPFIELESVNQI